MFIALVCALVLLLSSCKKNPVDAISQDLLQQYFETNILNRDFTVKLATDNGTDLTVQYSGYLFKLVKTTLYNGPMTATKGATVYSGTWSCNDDYSKLVISLPASPAEFGFLNREWKFTKKSIPVMELAPWGSLEPKILHMERQ